MSSTWPKHAVSDEIDLAELMQTLWRRKRILVVWMLAGLAAATLHAWASTQRWTSVAYLEPPQLGQIQAYLEQQRAIARIDGKQEIDTDALRTALFNRFMASAFTIRNRHAYLAASAYLNSLMPQPADDTATRLLVARLAEHSLRIEYRDENRLAPYYKLSFTAHTAEAAREVLAGYLAWVSRLAHELTGDEYKDALDARIQSRLTALDNIAFSLQAERDHRMARLDTALHTARKAGLTHYPMAGNAGGSTIIELNDSRPLFMLGEKLLRAKLAAEQERPLIYPPRYFSLQRELAELQGLRTLDIKALSYNYQLAPTLPAQRDNPGYLFTAVLGVLAGSVAGSCWVLGGLAFARRSQPA